MKIARPAFTLIELLVVVAIIALLLAILLPSLGQARAQAKDVKCLSSVRQWGIGTIMWSDENNGDLPWDGPSSEILSQTVDAEGTMAFNVPYFFANAIPPYVASESYRRLMETALEQGDARDVPIPGDKSIFICPSAQKPTPGADVPGQVPFEVDGTQYYYYFNYVINSKLENGSRDRWPIGEEKARLSWIRNPSSTVLLFDMRATVDEIPPDFTQVVGSNNLKRVHAKWAEMAYRHKEGANVLFADGSGRPVKFAYANSRQQRDHIKPTTWGYNQPDLIWSPLDRAR